MRNRKSEKEVPFCAELCCVVLCRSALSCALPFCAELYVACCAVPSRAVLFCAAQSSATPPASPSLKLKRKLKKSKAAPCQNSTH